MALMPWNETTSINEKERFVLLAQTETKKRGQTFKLDSAEKPPLR
jgi:hypothetical protein